MDRGLTIAGLIALPLCLIVIVVSAQSSLTTDSRLSVSGPTALTFGGSGTTWLTIPCPIQAAVSAFGCLASPPKKVVFQDYPEDSNLCIAATTDRAETCLSYGAFKTMLGLRKKED